MLLPAVTMNVTFWYASYAPGLLADGVNRTRLRADQRAYLLGPIMYAASIPLALALPIVSLGFYVVGPVFYGIVAARDRGWSEVGRG